MTDVIPRGEWGARPPRGKYTPTRWGSTIIVHHTAGEYVTPTPGRPGLGWRARKFLTNRKVQRALRAYDRKDGKVEEREEAAMRSIQALHQSGNGWTDVGYHYVIFPSGRVYEGRPAETLGAHARNANQHPGVSFAGNYEQRVPTPASLSAFHHLVTDLGGKVLIGHYRVPENATACPGRHLKTALGL